jgi:signal transduction histidine kinase
MSSTFGEAAILTIITSSLLLLLFVAGILFAVFTYQKRRYQHQKEIAILKKSFDQTLILSKLAIQEQTLDHISKELHANISQLASLININLSVVLPKSPSDIRHHIEEAKLHTRQLLAELKSISTSLNTNLILHIGFQKALNEELNKIEKTKVCRTVLTKSGEEYRLSNDREIILYRICQEVLNNVLKYANAACITVTICYSETKMSVDIKDDGIGFDLERVLQESYDSTGILNMQHRAKLIGADFSIFSSNNQGTVVKIAVPIQHH